MVILLSERLIICENNLYISFLFFNQVAHLYKLLKESLLLLLVLFLIC